MDGNLLFLVIALSACGSLIACKLPSKPTQEEYTKYIACLQQATGYTSNGGRWGRSVHNDLDRAFEKLRSKKAECVLKSNPQSQDYVNYVMCLQGNGFTSDGGRWGRSVDERLTKRGLESKSKRDECVLKSNPQSQDYVDYVICMHSKGHTTDGGRWGRSVDRELTRTRSGLESKSKRAECALKSNPQPQDYVDYVMCMQGTGFTSDGGRWGRSTDHTKHYRVMEKILRNVPNFGRWFQLRRENAHEQAEIPARQGGRDDDQGRVFSRQENGRVQDLANAGVTIIEHPVKRAIRLRDIIANTSP